MPCRLRELSISSAGKTRNLFVLPFLICFLSFLFLSCWRTQNRPAPFELQVSIIRKNCMIPAQFRKDLSECSVQVWKRFPAYWERAVDQILNAHPESWLGGVDWPVRSPGDSPPAPGIHILQRSRDWPKSVLRWGEPEALNWVCQSNSRIVLNKRRKRARIWASVKRWSRLRAQSKISTSTQIVFVLLVVGGSRPWLRQQSAEPFQRLGQATGQPANHCFPRRLWRTGDLSQLCGDQISVRVRSTQFWMNESRMIQGADSIDKVKKEEARK